MRNRSDNFVRLTKHVAVLAGFALGLLPVGCEKSKHADRPQLHPAGGHVIVAGKPAAGVVISFHPAGSASDGLVPAGTSGEDGSFRVGTFAPGDGAPAGEYSITCVWPKNASADAPEVDQLRGRYSGAAKSKLHVTIVAGTNELPVLQLK